MLVLPEATSRECSSTETLCVSWLNQGGGPEIPSIVYKKLSVGHTGLLQMQAVQLLD